MLRAGGNAVDAAVAAAFAVGAAEPNASGLGGEGMMVIRLAATGRPWPSTTARRRPPPRRSRTRPPDTGYAAAAVPGTVAGLTLALERYGTRPLADVLAPAIRIADKGFLARPTLAGVVTENFAAIVEERALAAAFCPGACRSRRARGARIPSWPPRCAPLPPAAPTCSTVARSPRGSPRRRRPAAGSSRATIWPAYRAIEREPVRAATAGTTSCRRRRPSAGVAVIEALQILEHFDLRRSRRCRRSAST